MKKLCCATAMAVVLSGCAGAPTKPLASGSTLQGKHIAVTQYAKPDFGAMTAGKAAFGVFGAMAMIGAGNDLVKAEHIEDPAIEIGEHLANDMAEKHSATVLPASQHIATDAEKPPALVKFYPDADLVLDVRTINWMFLYYPSSWGRYHVMYVARVRLMDGKTGSLVAQHVCKVVFLGGGGNAPTKDELLANHAAMLKQTLHKAAATCVGDVERQALML